MSSAKVSEIWEETCDACKLTKRVECKPDRYRQPHVELCGISMVLCGDCEGKMRQAIDPANTIVRGARSFLNEDDGRRVWNFYTLIAWDGEALGFSILNKTRYMRFVFARQPEKSGWAGRQLSKDLQDQESETFFPSLHEALLWLEAAE